MSVDISTGAIVGDHRILAELSQTSHLPARLAERLDTFERVVLKFAPIEDPSAMARLERETRAFRAAAGEGLVPWRGYSTWPELGWAHVATGVWGPSLVHLIDAEPNHRLPAPLALAFGERVARALAALHARGHAHGDVKPGNLLVDGSGKVALADLECARPFDTPAEAGGALMGTLPFIAPEVFLEGSGRISAASDLWGLGVVLWLALTGDYPFGHDPVGAVAAAVAQNRRAEWPSFVPEDARSLVEILLEPDPLSRPKADRWAAMAAVTLGANLPRLITGLATRVRATPAFTELGAGGLVVDTRMIPPPRREGTGSAAPGGAPRGAPAGARPPLPPPKAAPAASAPPLPKPVSAGKAGAAEPPRPSDEPSESSAQLTPRSDAAGLAPQKKRAPEEPLLRQSPPRNLADEVSSGDDDRVDRERGEPADVAASEHGMPAPAVGSDRDHELTPPAPSGPPAPPPPPPAPAAPLPPLEISTALVAAKAATAEPASAPVLRSPLDVPTTPGSQPVPDGAAAATPAPEALMRRAAARWFSRMNPARNFPLTVVISGRKIEIRAAKGMLVAIGATEFAVDPQDPWVEVEPAFAGCLVVPSMLALDVSGETTVARFWITPLAEGALPDACVRIRHHGKVVETLSTPTGVVARTWSHVCLALSIASPALLQVLEGLGWTPAVEVASGFPMVGGLWRALGPSASVLVLFALFLATGLVLKRLTRPLPAASEPALFPSGA